MCFSLEWLKQILILVVVVVAIIAMLKILIPFIVKKIGVELGEGWSVVVQCFRIMCWAIVAILVIIIVFMMISCLLSMTGGVSLLPHR